MKNQGRSTFLKRVKIKESSILESEVSLKLNIIPFALFFSDANGVRMREVKEY